MKEEKPRIRIKSTQTHGSPVSETYQFRSSPGGSLVFKKKNRSPARKALVSARSTLIGSRKITDKRSDSNSIKISCAYEPWLCPSTRCLRNKFKGKANGSKKTASGDMQGASSGRPIPEKKEVCR
ncbi:MAG: hypothetical protein D3906_01465 [Candidatus Electrothrix sp. AUS1_2]|nr:hypothetical protein [Candidatus Electrothrix sp. AUS1_2]